MTGIMRCARRIARAGVMAACLAATAAAAQSPDSPATAAAMPAGPACATSVPLLSGVRLPHAYQAVARRQALTVVAVGSSSTVGLGAREARNAYPARLESELRAAFPGVAVRVVNRGVNGEEAPAMLARFERDVAAEKPDLVIWQVGSNGLLKGVAAADVLAALGQGLERTRALGADAIVMSPQYAPRILAAEGREGLLTRLAAAPAALFPRYEVMREWRDARHIAFSDFLIDDGLHLNDWGYACTARLMARALAGAIVATPAQTAAR